MDFVSGLTSSAAVGGLRRVESEAVEDNVAVPERSLGDYTHFDDGVCE